MGALISCTCPCIVKKKPASKKWVKYENNEDFFERLLYSIDEEPCGKLD